MITYAHQNIFFMYHMILLWGFKGYAYDDSFLPTGSIMK